MASVTVTRPDGTVEQVVLADTKEAGYSYYPFLCSDGKTRYALLGEKTDANASHLWAEQDGKVMYALKSPDTAPTGQLGRTLYGNGNNDHTDTMTVTIPKGVKVLKLTTSINGVGTPRVKYIGVTPEKGYNLFLVNFRQVYLDGISDPVLGKIWIWMFSGYVGHDVAVTGGYPSGVVYDQGEANNRTAASQTPPPDSWQWINSAVFEYSPEINTHKPDIADY